MMVNKCACVTNLVLEVLNDVLVKHMKLSSLHSAIVLSLVLLCNMSFLVTLTHRLLTCGLIVYSSATCSTTGTWS